MNSRTYLALALLALFAAPAANAAHAGHAAHAARATLPVFDAEQLAKACDDGIAKTQAHIAALERLPLAQANVKTVLHQWNRLHIDLEDVQGPIDLLNNVAPDAKVREAGDACLLKLNVLATELFQNEKLFARVNRVVAKDPIDKKLKQDLIESFEDTGVALPPEKRARMKEILKRLEEIRLEYERNVRDNKTKLAFTAAEMKGLPEDYLAKAKRDAEGNYQLGFAYPEYEPFMENAENEEARQRYQFAFANRGTPKNLELLADTLKLRQEIATLYGLPSYADFVIRRHMAQKPQNVLKFLSEVKSAVEAVEKKEIADLAALKAERTGKPLAETRFNRWDVGYYENQMKKARFNIDQEALRRYFPAEASFQWVMDVSARLYGVRFERAEVPVWHTEVRYFDVKDAKTGKLLGGIYLDPFPREGKYGHAAAWPVRAVSTLANRRPISALVTNFNREGLKHDEVETLWHEFGHVLHGVLSNTRYAPQGGTSVERDFVEAPSQMYEEWARRKASFAVLAKLCKDCPAVDDDLVKRLDAARRYGKGIMYARQHLYAGYDMSISGAQPGDPLAVWEAMEGATTLGHVPGSQFPGQFSHLMSGYAAGYYGYMWSEVLALDMLSAFHGDIMDAKVGHRYRDLILTHGSERKASEMVRQFLGREPSPAAFFAEITGQRHD